MKTTVTQFISLFLLVLVTGVFWGTWFTLTRSLSDFSAIEFIHIGQVIIANVALPMKIIFPACLLFMLLSLWLYPAKKSAGFYWGVGALVLMLATLFVTLAVLVPIDNAIKNWTASAVPANWEGIRDRWDRFHAVRTLTSLLGFACFAVSVLFLELQNIKGRKDQ
jgi:uncharacterized membrane protein